MRIIQYIVDLRGSEGCAGRVKDPLNILPWEHRRLFAIFANKRYTRARPHISHHIDDPAAVARKSALQHSGQNLIHFSGPFTVRIAGPSLAPCEARRQLATL